MSPDTSENQGGWLLPPRKNKKPAPGLYLVATPIGNLGDITLRALDVLSAADLVVCEDTRVTGKLLAHFGLKKPLLPYNDHNADKQRSSILGKLSQGAIVAFVSDAGTPLVSDPGFKLVRACAQESIVVTAVPGASAVLSALQVSALPTDAFCFAGFLPAKDGARKTFLHQWKNVPASLVFFETAPRLEKSLKSILDVLGDREIAVTRELTKMFEEVQRMKVSKAIEFYESRDVKGEIVLVIAPPAEQDASQDDVESLLRAALEKMSVKDAAAFVAERTGRKKKDIYAMALKIAP